MKRLLILLALFLPALALADDHFRGIDGRWIDFEYGRSIWIKERRGFIQVKGLHRNKSWVRFDRVRNGRKFIDRNGNRIKIRHGGQLLYRNNRGDRHLFERRSGFPPHYNDRNRYRNRSFDWEYNRNRRNNPHHRWNNQDFRRSDLSGVWTTPLLNDRVFIERSDSGWRAKVGHRGNWTYYRPLPHSTRNFVDDRGNSLEVFSDGSILWRGGEAYRDIRLERLNR
jgi:hypothetical protein